LYPLHGQHLVVLPVQPLILVGTLQKLLANVSGATPNYTRNVLTLRGILFMQCL